MAYGTVTRVQAPVEMYDAVHAELIRRTGAVVEGLLLHVGRPTAGGFEVVEVWESKDECERYGRELVGPVMAELTHGQQPSGGQQTIEEFEVRGLVIPRADVAW